MGQPERRRVSDSKEERSKGIVKAKLDCNSQEETYTFIGLAKGNGPKGVLLVPNWISN